MATHSSVLAWRTPGTGEPGGLPSMGSHRVGHDWSVLAAAATDIMLTSISNFHHGCLPLKASDCDTDILRENNIYSGIFGASLVAEMVKNLPAMWETWVPSLGWEKPLEEWMATDSSILAWRIPWREEPDRLQSMGSQTVGHDWQTKHTQPRFPLWASQVAQLSRC